MSVEINGGNVGLTVSVKFDTTEAVNNLKQALNNIGSFNIQINTEKIIEAANQLEKLSAVKLNLEGQQESLQYFTNVTKELEKQVQASERIRNNMQTAGAKALIKQHNSEQKDLYTESQKLMTSIVKSEQQLLTLTGKEKQQLKEIIKDKRSQLNALGEQITHEHYSELYTQKRKEMENAITEQKIKQREITKQLRATEKEQTADNKNAERLVNAEKTYKRIVEVKTQLYKLTKDDPAVPTLKEELYNLNQLIRGYKSAKDTKAELQKMSEAADLKYRQNIGLIDSQVLQTQQKELKKLQETEKTEIKRYIDSLGTQIKDIYKTLYSTTDENSQTALSKRLTQLNEELNIYREMAEWKKTVAKLEREIDTTKTTALAKAMDAQTKANEARENGINKAWSGEYYSQYNKNLNESKTLEKQIREELVKTTGVKADSIKLDEQELEVLKQKGGYLSALASNLIKVRENITAYESLTRPANYNNVVKDFSIEEKQAQIEREKLSHTEKLLENQLKEARLAEEVIPLQQRLLTIQLERLSNNKYLTQEQRQELTTVQEMITALNGKTKAEVTANAQMIKNELSYQNQLATLNKENLSLEETIKLESKLATYQKNKVLRAIEDLETGKLAAHVDKERLETIRQMANSLDGADKSIIQSLSKTMTDGLSGVKHDANVSARIEKDYANEQSLANYISAQKDVLKNQATTLANEKLQGFVLKENYQNILKQIDALDGANKEEVKNQASLINKNIELEKSTALRSQELAQVQTNASQSVEAYYLEQESANKKAQLTAQSMKDKINELKAGKELTVEQQKQVANLEEMQRLMASNQILSMEQYTTLNDQFNAQLKHYNSELKQDSQIQAAKEELELTKQNLALNKQKLENRLKELEVSKNAKYLDQQQLATAKEMVATLTGSNTKELAQNTRLASSYIDNMVSNANVNRMRKLGDGAHSLGQSFKNLAGYISGAMIIRHFWQEMKNGLTVVKEVDSALTTLRITMTNFSEQDLSNLMSASKDLAVTLKTSFTDVLEVVKTVANETETMETIMAKSKPALILSNLTGLATSETVEMVQGVTKQFSKQFEEMGLSAEESAMKVADSMVAVSRALGMDFSTGISGMAEGIEIMGALASELKMSLEETIALMSSTAEQTRLTFSEIANAMKTTMARTIRISGTDEEISPEDLAKTEKALNGVNIKVRNTLTGEVRPFMDIMQDLAKIWDNLNDSQRGAIGDAMGEITAPLYGDI